MAQPNEDAQTQRRTLADIRRRRLLLGVRRRRRWRPRVGGALSGFLKRIAKGWRGVAVIVAVPSFALALMSYFEVHPVWPWEEDTEPRIELSIMVAEQAGPGTGIPRSPLPERTTYREEIYVSEGTDLVFAILVNLEPELAEEEIPLVLKVDLPKEETSDHIVRVSAEFPEAPGTETASATVRLHGDPACLIYFRDSAQFMATITGPLLEKLPDGGGESVLEEGFQDVGGLMSDWGVSKGVILFRAGTRESPQRSSELAGRNGSSCLPDPFGQVTSIRSMMLQRIASQAPPAAGAGIDRAAGQASTVAPRSV